MNDMTNLVKLVVTAPETHGDVVRKALGEAGAGKVGNYTFCSFSSKGTGRFLPSEGAQPAIGQVGVLEEVPEERIEVTVPRDILPNVLLALKAVHPYEEPAIDIYPLES